MPQQGPTQQGLGKQKPSQRRIAQRIQQGQ